MRGAKFLFIALISMVAFAACNKEESASLALERTALYFSSWNDAVQSIKYTSSNAVRVTISSCSEGWSAMVDETNRTIDIWTVGASSEGITNDDLAREGSVVVNALNSENKATSYFINVYISETMTLGANGEAANCYIITTPSTNYTFDAMHRPDGTALDTKRVALLWQNNMGVVRNVELSGDNATLYVNASEDDASQAVNTNAVVAAYNNAGEVIWSWHLWIVNESPLTATDSYSNGKEFMSVNLGAFTNSNGSFDTQQIYDSQGLFYQWGRKDPFPRPYFYDSAGGEVESRFNEEGTILTEKFVERTAESGNMEYTTKYPMRYIYNDQHSEYNGDNGDGVGDWLVTSDNNLWGKEKNLLNDPCPYGWRVPTAEELSVLELSAEEDNTALEIAKRQYGWHLSDGVSSYFYPACGRRRYSDGKVENMNYKDGVYPSIPEPWEGHYWTSSATTDGKAISLYFDLTTSRSALINKFVKSQPRFRANGLQVRCVKE